MVVSLVFTRASVGLEDSAGGGTGRSPPPPEALPNALAPKLDSIELS